MNENRTLEQRSPLEQRSLKRRVLSCLAASMASIALLACAGCAGQNAAATGSDSGGTAGATTVATTIDDSAYDFSYSDEDLDSSYDESSAVYVELAGTTAIANSDGSVSYSDGVLSITEAGTYVLSGTLDNGQVKVSCSDTSKVKLVLAGASISCSQGPAILVENADKCTITLAEGTQNLLADGSSYSIGDDEDAGGAVYSTCDLVLNGSGSASITGTKKHGVFSKDDVTVTGGTWTIESTADGVHGRDAVKVCDGTLAITAGDDGIASTNDEKAGKGYIGIDGGDVSITSTDKGMVAYAYMRMAAGNVNVDSGDDGVHCDGSVHVVDGTLNIAAGDDGVHGEYVLQIDGGTTTVSRSYEGLEAEKVVINDGEQHITSSDDGINASQHEDASTDDSTSDGGADNGVASDPGANAAGDPGAGQTQTATGQNGQPKGGPGQAPSGGIPDVQDQDGQMNGGPTGGVNGAPEDSANDVPRDNAGSMGNGGMAGNMGAGDMGAGAGNPGGGADEYQEGCLIQINGGYTVIDASADGLDSNGDIEMSAGVVLISGPVSGGDGSLDFAGTYDIQGGTLLAAGSTGMPQDPTTTASGYISAQVSGNAGQTISIVDSSGNVIASFTATKSFELVQACVDGMLSGQTYQVVLGGTVNGANSDGYSSSGTTSNGTTAATAVAETLAK